MSFRTSFRLVALSLLCAALSLSSVYAEPDQKLLEEGRRLDGISAQLYMQGKSREAIQPLIEATEYYKKALGTEHRWVGDNYTHLGNMYYNLKDFGKAEEYYKKSLDIFKKTNGSCQMGDALKNYAVILRSTNRAKEAAQLENTQAKCPPKGK